MSAVRYPVAANADQALARPAGRAARESEAGDLARGPVKFVTEAAGPAFPTREAALEAWKAHLDEASALSPDDRYCKLKALIDPSSKGKTGQARPVYKNGKRWGAAPKPPKTIWRLMVSYWRIVGAEEQRELEQARKARKRADARLDAKDLRALAQQPLQPVRPQKALDIGLFEYRPPDAPHIVMPDE